MQVGNLNFFDKYGDNLNLDWSQDDQCWKGIIYLSNVSTYLYDNENIFILEQVGSDYKFPVLNPGTRLEFRWVDNSVQDSIFMYEVERDYALDNYFINKKTQIDLSYDDLIPTSGSGQVDLNLPLQLNVAFSPVDEVKYESTLEIYLVDESSPSTREKVAEIGFYGEGINEDERLGIWARNFGIRFNREDANILKDYNIKEAFPDWDKLNAARKNLLVNKEHIFPYIGTYKGLSNFINMLGYKDVLHIKEYWKNANVNSAYRDKKIMVDISDYLDDGKIDEMNILDQNRNIKFGRQFKKTEMLALVYEFTRATDNFDDDGVPEVEETTDFTVDEVFYKLNQLKKKVKSEFLPLNVKIEDVIGEFVYFQKLTIKFWKDDSKIFSFDLNEESSVQVYPDQNVNLLVRSLSPLRRLDYPDGSFNQVGFNTQGVSNPYDNGQRYPASHVDPMIDSIKNFYDSIKTQRYPDLGKRLSWEDGDDPEKTIGAPVVLSVYNNKFTFQSFRGITFDDLASMGSYDPYFTLDNIDLRNFYEITWKITKPGPNPYSWQFRGKAEDYHQLPHFLPYHGTYRVTAELHDFYGNTNVFSTFITVQDDQIPQMIAVTKLEDKFEYTVQNLENIRLQDFGSSPVYFPKINVLDSDSTIGKIDPDKNILEWDRYYKNGYGMGQKMYDAEIWNPDTESWVAYTDPAQSHPKKLYWGLGENREPIKLQDLKDVTIGSLFFSRVADFMWTGDFKAGFYIQVPVAGMDINISLFSPYTIPAHSNLDELVDILNSSTHPGISLFNYELITGDISAGQYIIHAQAKYLSKNMYHILSSISSPSGIDPYTFFTPREIYSDRLVNYLSSISNDFDEDTLFLVSKTSDLLNGQIQDPNYWVNAKYWSVDNDEITGYLPTVLDQNSYNINDIKVYDSSFSVPENSIVSFSINSIDGKNEFIWTLRDIGREEEVIKVRSVPFFFWKFKDLGKYELTCEILDNKNNSLIRKIDRHVNVLDRKQYIKNIEKRLNRRKFGLLK